jgi:hypothetical protein
VTVERRSGAGRVTADFLRERSDADLETLAHGTINDYAGLEPEEPNKCVACDALIPAAAVLCDACDLAGQQ